MVSRRLFLSAAAGAGLALSANCSFGQTAAGGQWRRVRDIPQGANEVIGAAVDGKFLVYGGLSDFVALGLLFMYDPTKDEWTSLPKPPVPVHHGAAVGVAASFMCSVDSKSPTMAPDCGSRKTTLGLLILSRPNGTKSPLCQRLAALYQRWQ